MANIREKQKDGKIFSFSFTACLERDAQGKQVRRYTTWTPPEGLTSSRARKAAERAADAWENEIKAEYQKEKEAKGRAYMLPAEKQHDDFVNFVNETWFSIQAQGNNRKAKTVSFYSSMTKILNKYFKGRTLQSISPIDIQKYLVYLRTKYQGRFGRPLTPKTVHHQYNTLNLIFNFAEEQEMISKNPMRKVEAPKKQKKSVDALTAEQAQQFFSILPSCPLDFRCILQLLTTTGMRRGECMGLKWRDIDEKDCTLSIEHNVSYTPESGVIVSTPKTANSIRTIPIMPSTLQLLQQLKQETQQQHPVADLKDAFLFPKGNETFTARDPNSVTRRVKRFMRNNGFPDFSPHDLRHTYITNPLYSGVDPKTVQYLAGHENSKTTMDIYAKVKYNKPEELFGVVNGAFHQATDD